MKKPVIILFASAAATLLACSTPEPGWRDDPKTPPAPKTSTAGVTTSLEQLCFDDDLAAVRKADKDKTSWVKPESCTGLPAARFEEIHGLVLLKFKANG
jgi:hypothetical protein